MSDELRDAYDVVVIGGGAAGLSAGMMLGRSLRTVAVIDAGEPRNAPAGGVHGLLGHDGLPPAELLAKGREEVRRYGGHVVAGEVTGAGRLGDTFEIRLADGRSTTARRLLVTTGLGDVLPDVPGVHEQWGSGVIHCPYCHGYEVRGQTLGVLASGPLSVHQALLFHQWSDDVVYLAGEHVPDDGQAEKLAARGIEVVEGIVEEILVEDDRITGVRLQGGRVVPLEVVVVGPRMVARAKFLAELDLWPAAHPSGMGEHLEVDATGRTSAPGIWAAGNVADLAAQVGAAAAQGAWAAAQINTDLVDEETETAVREHRG